VALSLTGAREGRVCAFLWSGRWFSNSKTLEMLGASRIRFHMGLIFLIIIYCIFLRRMGWDVRWSFLGVTDVFFVIKMAC